MDDGLRPDWDHFIGQEALKLRLNTHIEAANESGRALNHLLLAGPPGFGKTSLAQIIAARLHNEPMVSLKMPIKPASFIEIMKRFEPGILFLDEIHLLPKAHQDDLLLTLLDEEQYISLPNGRRLYIDWITVIAATTEPEKLTAPLLDRFPLRPAFAAYSDDELGLIVTGMAKKVGVRLRPEDAIALGKAAGGTPRNCRSFVFAARDLRSVTGKTPSAAQILSLCEVEPDGLTKPHMDYLRCLDRTGGKSGVDRLAKHLRLHPSVLLDLERLLVSLELITYGEKGREMLSAGYARLNGRRVVS